VSPYYDHGGITLYLGDCREIIPALTFDALVTDPPYGVDFAGKAAKGEHRNGGYIGGDDASVGPAAVRIALKSCERGVVFSGSRLLHDYPKPRDVGCVYCPAGVGTGPWGFVCFHAVLFYGARPGGPRSPSSLFAATAKSDNLGGHPCAKPVRWLTWAVSLASLPSEIILDPFAGSGTTLVAAKNLGRRAIGIEIEERYCEIAARRLSQGVLNLGGNS
jgi:site-specific DNA-methyltransferase (adenine-specific)